MSHTPAPWMVKKATQADNTGGYDYCILDEKNKLIAEVFEHVGWKGSSPEYDKYPAYINAKLIAAAPELLEALKLIQQEIKLNQGCVIEQISIIAHAAIKKAEGK
jgi:hypothetical protein